MPLKDFLIQLCLEMRGTTYPVGPQAACHMQGSRSRKRNGDYAFKTTVVGRN